LQAAEVRTSHLRAATLHLMTMNGEACACSTAMTDLLLTFQMTTNRDLRREEQTQSLTDSYGYRPRKSAVDAVGDARKKREKEKGKAIEPQLSKSRKENQEELQNERTSHKEETSLSNFGRLTVRKMKVGPSEPPCRRGLQTAISCFGPKTAVVNVMVKKRGVRSRQVWIREMSANDPLMKHRKPQRRHPKPGLASRPGTSMKGTYLLVMRVSGVQEA